MVELIKKVLNVFFYETTLSAFSKLIKNIEIDLKTKVVFERRYCIRSR